MFKPEDFKVMRRWQFWFDSFILVFLIFLIAGVQSRDLLIQDLQHRLQQCSK